MRHLRPFAFALVILLLAGCAVVNERHPAVSDQPGPNVASVYFIRPQPVIYKTYAEAPVTIEYEGKPLLKLSERTYTLVYIKPSRGKLKIYNNTLFTNLPEGKRVWKEREYRFVAGRTYFIHVKQVDEEFRGIFYDPVPVDLATAKRISRHLYRIGPAANEHPIAGLTEADIVPPPESSGRQGEPVTPEQLYRPEDYMKRPKN